VVSSGLPEAVEQLRAGNAGLLRRWLDGSDHLPVDELTGWIEPMHGEVTAANRPLLEWLRGFMVDDHRHRVLLDEGLASPSLPRRELSEALLRLAP
jgi:hypothetical protein